ncbi:hypothetical protein BWQ96_08369 [Gracilariopsis chorda]|uniref:Uncharacterized protein n=1 Tax=Gracilariopsis chorda TaxID=448386 RepID=A0A2V3IIK8_9FLOR|nr:hypothetical protein BWQ96_08369 [Gracilariopsis chorda]|eukprot:PXF41917.1 hypothetical protein BWQ96_08369 [Gracilariopsis chorda]
MKIAALSDKWYIVIPAYVAAFMPWTAFSTKDFISDKWKTVRRTRTDGYINLLCSIIPAIYILFYATTQYTANDWQEGSAAIAALLFALLHGARSAWGLWQLYVFRTWCAESIDALEAMGITFIFSDKERRHRVEKNCRSAREMSDEMLVNDSIVDNQIIHGDTVCHVQYGDAIQLRTQRMPDTFTWLGVVHLMWEWFLFLAKTIFCVGVMLCDSLRFSVGIGPAGKLRQVPNRPAEVWINWAIVFAAQGLRAWMSEFSVLANPRDRKEHDESRKGLKEWEKRASYFASEVLSTCIMQLWPELQGEKKRMEPMLWSGWDETSTMYTPEEL